MSTRTLTETPAAVRTYDGLQSYLALAAEWPPHLPRDDADYDLGVEAAYRLDCRREAGETLDAGEEMYVEAVVAVLAAYDEKHGNLDVPRQ